ncbi:MAG: GNAT family N-acetyltransferase [Candidatus Hodarchaeales archaeon]
MKKKEEISIVRAHEEDSVILAEISKDAFHTDVLDGIAPSSWKPSGPPGYDSPDFQNFIISVIDSYKILLGDEIVGGIYLDSGNKEHCILERIFVSPAHHNKGIAGRAMELVHDKYPEANIWTLGTPKWNARTRHFYEKHGYVQVGWDEVETPDNPDCWGIWYQKTIRPHQFTKINQLVDGMFSISVEGKVAKVSAPKEVKLKNGKVAVVATAELVDDSGTIDLVAWENNVRLVTAGKNIRVENAIVSSYKGKLQLEIKYGRIISLL